jgi:hypothetical protein
MQDFTKSLGLFIKPKRLATPAWVHGGAPRKPAFQAALKPGVAKAGRGPLGAPSGVSVVKPASVLPKGSKKPVGEEHAGGLAGVEKEESS